VAEASANGPDDADSPTEVRAQAGLNQDITLAPGEKLSLNLKYTGWEDADFLYDNYTYDSGFRVQQDPLLITKTTAKSGKVEVRYADKVEADWMECGYCIRLYLDGQEQQDSEPITQKTGKSVDDGNGTKFEEWKAYWENVEFNDTTVIEIAVTFGNYHRDQRDQETWVAVPGDSSSGGGGGGDDDDDDAFEIAGFNGYAVSGGIGALVLVGLAAVVLIKKRGEDEEYEEEDEEEYDDDEEEEYEDEE